MKKLIGTIIFIIFSISISCLSFAAEETSDAQKKDHITRWEASIGDESMEGGKATLALSILNAETDPKIAEAYITTDQGIHIDLQPYGSFKYLKDNSFAYYKFSFHEHAYGQAYPITRRTGIDVSSFFVARALEDKKKDLFIISSRSQLPKDFPHTVTRFKVKNQKLNNDQSSKEAASISDKSNLNQNVKHRSVTQWSMDIQDLRYQTQGKLLIAAMGMDSFAKNESIKPSLLQLKYVGNDGTIIDFKNDNYGFDEGTFYKFGDKIGLRFSIKNALQLNSPEWISFTKNFSHIPLEFSVKYDSESKDTISKILLTQTAVAFSHTTQSETTLDDFISSLIYKELPPQTKELSTQTFSEEKKITRWTVPIWSVKDRANSTFVISVYDIEKNPVLIELSYVSPNAKATIDFHELKSFEVVRDPHFYNFHIQFNDKFYDVRGFLIDLYKNFESVPHSVTFGYRKGGPKDYFFSLNGTWHQASVETFTPEEFEPIDPLRTNKVRELSTVNDVNFDTYFKPKGIRFTFAERKKLGQTKPPGDSSKKPKETGTPGVYKARQSNAISSAANLELEPILQNRRDAVWELLQKETKPTMAEFLKAVVVMPSKNMTNPFQAYSRNYYLKSELVSLLPNAIGQFEKAFPNAIWYALGRDIYLFGDALDAYYMYLGQKNRVIRLPASAPSFEKEDTQEIIDFMKTHGINFSDIDEKTTPRIIFDVTSYSRGFRNSQSTQLMKAAYTEWTRLGRDPKKLLEKVNFLSVSSGKMIEPNTDIKEFFSQMKFDPAPEKLLRVDGPMSLQYSLSWHGLYEKFQRVDKDTVITSFGEPTHIKDRLAMLAELWDIAAVVMNKEFASQAERYIKFYRNESGKADVNNDGYSDLQDPSYYSRSFSTKDGSSKNSGGGKAFRYGTTSESERNGCEEVLTHPIGFRPSKTEVKK